MNKLLQKTDLTEVLTPLNALDVAYGPELANSNRLMTELQQSYFLQCLS
jgi:hypothetical protein